MKLSLIESEAPAIDVDAAFELFWKAYPKRVGKPLAKAKFREIVTKGLKTRTLDRDSGCYVEIDLQATVDEIIAGAKAYARSQIDRDNGYKLKDGGKYTCHPASWLNQGRWMDLV
jgi:hypothetical protein